MKKRLDILVAEKENISRTKAQALIMAGEVLVEGALADKPGTEIIERSEILIKEKFPYVSRGALKLKQAYEEFDLDFAGKIICDVGASTGGFTDFALSMGAVKIYAVDTGKGQIDQKLREDKRVVLFENTNIKEVDNLPEPVDYFVVDVSFISLKKVLPAILKIIENSKFKNPGTSVVALIKPQFEVGKKIADKAKGIIRDPEVQLDVVKEIGAFAESSGFKVEGLAESPILGAKGNKEFLIYLNASN